MKKTVLKINGMSCSACSNSLEKYLKKQVGIIDASVNLVMAEALINYEDNLTIDDLNNFVNEAGFKSLGEYNPKMEEKASKRNWYVLVVFIIFSCFYFYVSMGHMLKFPPIISPSSSPLAYSILLLSLTIPYLIYAWDIFKSGIKNMIHLSFNMDTLVTLGVFASFSYSVYNVIMIFNGNIELVHNLYFESCAFVVFFIKLGRYIDHKSKDKTKQAIEELVQITPEVGIVIEDGKEKEVTIDEVKVGDILVVKPGMKIAVDGEVIKGSTHIDEAFISGESKPVSKVKGSKVYAGSINIDGEIYYKAEKIGANSSISEIVHLVLEATNSKAPISRVADKVSGYFVPFIIIVAILSFIVSILMGIDISSAINKMVTILVVACPCALGLATPLAIVIAMGLSAKKGILIKSSAVLEGISKVDTIVFDKTGTLTYGKLHVFKMFNYSKMKDKEILDLVGNLESNSKHPISTAFNVKRKIEVKNFKEIAGIGIKGNVDKSKIYVGNNKILSLLKIENKYDQDEEYLKVNGCSIVYVIKNNKVIGLIGVKDILRSNAKNVINKLKKMNIEVMMLSGDNEKTASIIAKEVGIEKVISEVMPKEKVDVIRKLESDNHKVMMVGDGINDAPSLASSFVGVSIGKNNDIASSSADVVLIHDDLDDILNVINISKKTIINIKENLFWAFIYNILMIPIAVGLFKGIVINPMIASLAMTLSSLTVVLNALRLRNIKMEGEGNV